jgi:hypothetical protein
MPKTVQKQSRKREDQGRDSFITARLRTNLDHLVKRVTVGNKRKQACELVANRLSVLANLGSDHAWGWKYIAGICSGSLDPSKRFMRAFSLYEQHPSPRQTQWFYFARCNRRVASINEKVVLKELITSHFRQMGYKPVTYTRYMQIKQRRS